MRLFRFFLIFSVIFIMVTACGADEDEEMDTEGGNTQDDTGDNTGDNSGDENQQNINCGNNVIDAGETCDGNAQECTTIDPGYTGGIATCKPDCSGWNTADCKGNSSSEDPTNPGNEDPTNPGGNGGFDKDSKGIWVDPKTYLIWENPMGNKGTGGLGPTHAQSQAYCENLILAGADDWRLPTIDELRTIVRGVSTTMTGGTCPTSENCTDQDTCNKNKNNSQSYGYSCFGCYALDDQYKDGENFLTEDDCQLTDVQLENEECYIVPAMFGDPCNGTWSNTPNTSTAGTLANAFWYLNYKAGYIGSDSDTLSGANWVRCVRQGTAADVPEQDAEAETDPDWECKVEADCPEGQWCEKHKCVLKPAETYTAANGLEWQAGRVDRVEKWDAAKAHCEDLDYAGHDDWRLPNLTELKTIVSGCDKTNECPVTAENPQYPGNYSTVCKTCSSGNYLMQEIGQQVDFPYWTSTTDDPTKNYRVWAINFINGEVFYSYASANHYARCVRGSMN